MPNCNTGVTEREGLAFYARKQHGIVVIVIVDLVLGAYLRFVNQT